MPDAAIPNRMKQGWTPGFEAHVDRLVRPSQHRFEPVLAEPARDQATALRDWSTNTYCYPRGAVVAYPTYTFDYDSRPALLHNDLAYSAISPAIFLTEVISLPFWLIVEPGVTEVTYHGARYPASTTLAPPLPKQ